MRLLQSPAAQSHRAMIPEKSFRSDRESLGKQAHPSGRCVDEGNAPISMSRSTDAGRRPSFQATSARNAASTIFFGVRDTEVVKDR